MFHKLLIIMLSLSLLACNSSDNKKPKPTQPPGGDTYAIDQLFEQRIAELEAEGLELQRIEKLDQTREHWYYAFFIDYTRELRYRLEVYDNLDDFRPPEILSENTGPLNLAVNS